jgi:ATP-dependent DNA helicase DinG
VPEDPQLTLLAAGAWGSPPPAAFVAVDCETTGLDPERDAIIQLAAVRVTPEGSGEWWTLVAPGRPVPLHVQRLTGIDPRRLDLAPPPAQALAALGAFVGSLPLFAHHAAFDEAFLHAAARRAGVPSLPGPFYDTLELARLVDPLAPSHRLADLAGRHGLELAQAHDALHDARATAALTTLLLQRARGLPPALRRTLAHLLARTPGAQAGLVRSLVGPPGPPVVVLRPAAAPAEASPPARSARAEPSEEAGPSGAMADTAAALQPHTAGDALGPEPPAALRRLLQPDSPLAAALGHFEVRPGQAAMMAAVWRAFARDRHLVVEAGTGTGKSIAYLLPALEWAAARGERVAISTHTLHLQEQLLGKDVPALTEGVAPGRVALLKGRGQYLCLRLWEEALAEETDPADGPFLARIAAWVAATETGDRGELALFGEEDERFAGLAADAVACTGRRCPFYEPCFLFRARRRADAADVVVVNHALLCADLRAQGSLLPECPRIVCDEAHHLEDVASQHLGRAVGERAVERFFRLLERQGRGAGRVRAAGLLPQLRARFSPLGGGALASAGGDSPAAPVLRRLAEASGALRTAREGALAAWTALRAWTQARRPAGAGERWEVRLPAAGEEGDGPWPTILAEGERLATGLRGLASSLEGVAAALDDGSAAAAGEEGRVGELRTLAEQAADLATSLDACLRASEGWVAWVECAPGRGREPGAVTLRACPVDPAEALRTLLFTPRRSVVLTSATLSVRGNCAFLRGRLGLDRGEQAERTDELLVGSPFDFRRQALLAIPTDLPRLESHRAAAAVPAVAPWLRSLLGISRGHALLLFTSHRLLREVRAALKPALEGEGITCLAQGVDGSRTALTETLRRNEDAVVLGTASFWEGVDVQGEGLRLVVIAQLPFTPPDQPLQQARQEAVSRRGGQPFGELQLPQAVLRFKQGFGRLIRSGRDRGAVVVLDPRLVTASYGRTFLQSLPDPEMLVAPADEVLVRVRAWLEEDQGLGTPEQTV